MRTIGICVIFALFIGVVSAIDNAPLAQGACFLNEIILPNDSAWTKAGDLEVQLTTSSTQISKKHTTLPVYVWFRNPTDHPVSHKCIAGDYCPHGNLRVTGPNGETILRGDCRKKHLMEEVKLIPKQVRGFSCDAFNQWCFRREDMGELTPGIYLLEFMGAKLIVTVGK